MIRLRNEVNARKCPYFWEWLGRGKRQGIKSRIAFGLHGIENIALPESSRLLCKMIRTKILARYQAVKVDGHIGWKVDHVQRVQIVLRQNAVCDLIRQFLLNIAI